MIRFFRQVCKLDRLQIWNGDSDEEISSFYSVNDSYNLTFLWDGISPQMKEVSLRCNDQETQPVVKSKNLFPCNSLFPVGAFGELDSYSFSTSNSCLLTSTMLEFRFRFKKVYTQNFANRSFIKSSYWGWLGNE